MEKKNIFSSSKINEQYQLILDDKISSYDESLNEVSSIDPENYTEDLMSEISKYLQTTGNMFDTSDTMLYKLANTNNVPVKLMTRNNERIYELFNILEYASPDQIKNLYKRLDPFLSFNDFIHGCIWEPKEPREPAEILTHFETVLPDFNKEEFTQEQWESNLTKWRLEDLKIIEKIFARQADLITLTVNKDINRTISEKNYKIKKRKLEFSIKDSSGVLSIYDKFIFSIPNEKVPFIKVILPPDSEIYKVYSITTRKEINEWINKDEKINALFQDQEHIYFLIKLSNEKINYCECYLTNNKLSISIPSSLGIDTITATIQEIVSDLFGIEIFDIVEKSVSIETFIENFPVIEAEYLQFYLATNPETSSMYFKETTNQISSKTRKISLYYKPFSEIYSDKYVIKYKTSNIKKIVFKGSNEEKSVNFFVNIFGRVIRGFFIRQTAIKKAILKTIFESSQVDNEEKDKKKKKIQTTDNHLKTLKDKINLIQSIINVPKDYSSYCQCRRQPVIMTQEEAIAWGSQKETIFDKKGTSKNKKEIKTYELKDGRVIYFTCTSEEYPTIYLTKEPNEHDELGKMYPLSPCCWNKKRKEITNTDNIYMVSEEVEIVPEKEVTETVSIWFPQEIKVLLTFLSGNEEFNIVYQKKKSTNSSLLECLLLAFSRVDMSIEQYRTEIMKSTNPILLAQEALGIERTPEECHAELSDLTVDLDYRLHYRLLEEFFDVNIYVFTVGNEPTVDLTIETDFELLVPYHKVFSCKTLNRSRQSIILLNRSFTNNYFLITHSNGLSLFDTETSIKLHDLFTNVHQVLIKNSKESVVKNMFSRISWVSFFEKDPIKFQEIDISGKCRVVQLESGMTISIPPTQPFNVPLITEYIETPVEIVKSVFGEPNTVDDKGLWYNVMKIENLIYVLTGYHGLVNKKDKNYMSKAIPLNPFVPKIREDISIFKEREIKRNLFALIQIIQWGWRIDKRPEFNQWFKQFYYNVAKPEETNSLGIYTNLPEVKTAKEGFQYINKWWPEMFMASGKIKLWTELYNKILVFFERESKVMQGSYSDPVVKRLVGFYEYAEDYPKDINVRVFVNKNTFKTWSRVDRQREENTKIEIIKVNSEKTIDLLTSKLSPFRVAFENHWLVIYNVLEGTLQNAMNVSYYWSVNKKLPLPKEEIKKCPSKYKPQVLAFDKLFSLKFINYEDSINKVNILKYPDSTYAAILI